MKYDAIIIGGGAAGLFCAAATKINNGLILDKSSAPGRKLLMAGSGQCNLTHGGDIKDFINHYGEHGKKVRSPLYKVSNLKMMERVFILFVLLRRNIHFRMMLRS